MAKKDKEKEVETQEGEEEIGGDPRKISKAIIKALNKDGDKKMAWSLATDKDNPTDVKEFINTGSTILNYVISNRRGGGVPVGKITEVVGEEATGKSLLVTQLLAETQKKGGLAVYIDEENALNPEFAARLGLNLSELVYMQCGSVEEVGEQIRKVILLARAKDVKRIITIVWDSIAATPPKAELEGDFDPNSRIGLQAKAIAKMMRMLTQTVGRERVTLVFTNQMKVKIGVMYGDPMGTPGGKAVPYHASVRVRLNRSKELKGEDEQTEAIHTRAKVIKNRLGPPLRTCEFDIHFSTGINDGDSIRDYLHSVGEIKKKDGWMYMFDVPIIEYPHHDEKTGEVDMKRPETKLVELKFRERRFGEHWNHADKLYRETFREHVLKILDKHLIVTYETKTISDQDLDPESFMDNEAVTDIVTENTSEDS